MKVPDVAENEGVTLAARWSALRVRRVRAGLTMHQVGGSLRIGSQNLHRYETLQRVGAAEYATIAEAFLTAYERAVESAQRKAARL